MKTVPRSNLRIVLIHMITAQQTIRAQSNTLFLSPSMLLVPAEVAVHLDHRPVRTGSTPTQANPEGGWGIETGGFGIQITYKIRRRAVCTHGRRRRI